MTKSNSSLLTSEERTICEQISKSDEGVYNQRAQVLLALNKGVSQAEAGELTGLTIGQVKYCLQRFRQLRTASIFSTETQWQKIQAEPKLSNQIVKNDSKIEESINQLKLTQEKLNKSKEISEPDAKSIVTKDPDNEKKADNKVKIKKPKKKPKKAKKPKKKKKKQKK